ncbi:MAG: carotenoid oxygenase family protein [Frigidibacter sp.]|nr:carotenoid oxygenase family protein [Frigidibacter sp.]MDP3340828.1 carotenoid oxygenase family protein [Frigidibacter sp.]
MDRRSALLRAAFANAWEDAAGQIILERPYFDRPAWGKALDFNNGVSAHGAPPAGSCVCGQWRIDPNAGTAKVVLLDDLTVEFPSISLAHTGRESRFVYACSFPGAGQRG